ncbi:MAG: 23S rRNA (pseudouridine(1915)-N(3))-methyltransferase RlmH [Kiloniellales bacterium]|jgi:23S rRNA (pseudouridine1915-N3)-methyltransferase|nr:23S rRNA (pseudouridine(1915)-N(3))-methyltransferase RlmH [Kiloniellales bacterium]
MRITLVAVGRAKSDATAALYRDFAKRLRWPLSLREVEERRPLDPATRMEREGERLLAAVPKGARLVALDARGQSLDSAAFGALLGRWQDQGVADLAFAIGGADGLAPAVREGADLVLALGAMTWPHLLVRVMLAEQLYRAQCILDGHPYHRG